MKQPTVSYTGFGLRTLRFLELMSSLSSVNLHADLQPIPLLNPDTRG